MFQFFIKNKFVATNQSGFKPGYSCIKECSLIYRKHSIRSGTKVLKNLLELLIDFLKDRKQRAVLNGQVSNEAEVIAGVPQGSILGPLVFLIYINDLATVLTSNAKLFPDDTSLVCKQTE